MSYRQENRELTRSFLQRTLIDNCRTHENENFERVEIILTKRCNQACKYCYVNRFGKKLFYPKEDKILKNLEIFLDWILAERLTPKIEIFSGEPLAQEIGFKALELIYEKIKDLPRERLPNFLSIPTNCSFILDEETTKRVQEWIDEFASLGIRMSLSASVDGLMLENKNRPMRKRAKDFLFGPGGRGQEFYDRLFSFAKKNHMGFHPMIYSEEIDKWRNNFLWFQEMFAKFSIPKTNVYLLEVRNVEWSGRQIREYARFMRFLIRWSFENLADEDPQKMIDTIFKERLFNTLCSPWTTCGRGIGCSIQSDLAVRMSDLAIVPCHRTMYEGFEFGYFKIRKGKIIDIEPANIELMVTIYSTDIRAFPQCESCLMKFLCSGQCLGAMYEATGDMFSPIPTVCQLEHAKILAQIEALKDIGAYEILKERLNEDKKASLNLLEEVYEQGFSRDRKEGKALQPF